MNKKDNNWKDRLNVVYSTDPDCKYETADDEECVLVPPNEQQLRLRIEKNGRGGKTATIISGFRGSRQELSALAKTLKTYCGAGGSAKDNEIIIQGDMRNKLIDRLKALGYYNTK